MSIEDNNSKELCWKCVPCEYESYNSEPNDLYDGHIFSTIEIKC